MRALKNAVVTHKKPNAEMLKKRKAEMKSTKSNKAMKKDQNAPKRPATAFFIFMEEFRKTFKEKFPDAKAGPAVGKAGGEKWKSMSDAEKAPYAEKSLGRKAEYEIALEVYKKKLVTVFFSLSHFVPSASLCPNITRIALRPLKLKLKCQQNHRNQPLMSVMTESKKLALALS
ncbi:High mobility group B protein 3, partial [Cucurbita argyrosperma subsp. sororia]